MFRITEDELQLIRRALRAYAKDQYDRADGNPAEGRRRVQVEAGNDALALNQRLRVEPLSEVYEITPVEASDA